MMRMLTLATGVAVGYVLGAKAGRERYDQIVESFGKMTGQGGEDGRLTSMRSSAADRAATLTDTARQKAHDTIDLVDQKVDEAADKVREQADKASPSSAPSSGVSSTTTS